jgi:hypothetical protein
MSNIIHISQRRSDIEKPEEDCIKHDEYGRPLYLFAYEFDHADGKTYSFDFWAYDIMDAEGKLASIKYSAKIAGQIFAASIPA